MNISLKISRYFIVSLFAFILFKIALDLSYYFLISDIWGYAAFIVNVNWTKVVESYLLLIIVFIFLPNADDKLSSILIFLLVLISYIPLLTIYSLKDESRMFMYAATFFWLMVFFCQSCPPYQYRPYKMADLSVLPFS